MLYLRNISVAQRLLIPNRRSNLSEQSMRLLLRQTTTKQEFAFDVLDIEANDAYYNLAVTLNEEMPMGEYEYTLKGVEILSSGLLVIGSEKNPYQYTKETTYKQYGK